MQTTARFFSRKIYRDLNLQTSIHHKHNVRNMVVPPYLFEAIANNTGLDQESRDAAAGELDDSKKLAQKWREQQAKKTAEIADAEGTTEAAAKDTTEDTTAKGTADGSENTVKDSSEPAAVAENDSKKQ